MYDDNRSSLEAAAEAAAKVNAMLIAKGKLKPSQVNHNQTTRKSGSSNLVIAEVDINDVPIVCRNMLTRGATQEEISKMSGSAVSTRGRYMAIEDRMRNPGERALYLCVQGPNQEAVDLAVKRINEIIQNAIKQRSSRFSPAIRPPPVMGAPRHGPPMNHPPPLMSIGPQPPVQTVAVIQEKLYIGLEHAPPSFDVKSKIMGVGGSFLNHIINETGGKVTLRGKGSGFIDPATGREAAFEPMHVHIQHTTVLGMQQAKQLAENLIQTVQTEYASFQQVLAAMPTPVNPGTAAFITGLQQTSLAGGNLFGPQPGITTLSHLQQQSLAQVQAPGVQLAAHPGMINPQVLPVSTPTSVVMSGTSLNSSLSNLAPSAIITPAPGLTVSAGGPALVVPTTLGTSLAPVPVVQSLPVSGQSIVAGPPPPTTVSSQVEAATAMAAASAGLLPNTSLPPPMLATPVPTGAAFDVPITDSQFIGAPGVNGAQPTHVILSQAPQQVAQIPVQMGGPQIATPFGGPAQAIAPGGAPLATGPPLGQPSAGPPGAGMQIVTQTALPPPGIPPPGAPGPLAQPQQFFSQYAPVSSGPPAYSIVTSSMIGSSSPATYTLATSTYTYGLKDELPKRRFTEEKQEEKIPENLLGYQHGPPHLTNLMASGPPPPAGIAVTMVSNTMPVGQPYLATSLPEDARPQTFGSQAGNGVVMVGPPTSMAERTDTDKHLMPPPNVKGMKRGHGGSGSQESEKKSKHGYEDESEDSGKHRGPKALPQPPPPPPEAEHPDMLEQEHREHMEREREREYFNPHFPGGKHQSFRAASPPGRHSPSQFDQMNQQQLPPFDQYSQSQQEQFGQGGQGPPPQPHPHPAFEQGGQGQPQHQHPQFEQPGQGHPHAQFEQGAQGPPPHAQFDQFPPPQQFHPQQQLPPFSVSSSQGMAPYQSPPSPQPPYSQAQIRPPEGQILVSQHNPIQPAQQNALPPQFQNSALPPMPQNGFSQQFVSQASQSPFQPPPPPPPPPQSQFPPPGMQYWVGPT